MAGPLKILYKNVARVDAGRCVRCGRCARACPLHAIEWERGRHPRVSRKLCIGCGICVNACPVSAIELARSVSLLPALLVASVVLASLGGFLVLTVKPTPEAATEAVTPRPAWAEVPEIAPVAPAEPGPVNMTYYMMLEQEAGTEGG